MGSRWGASLAWLLTPHRHDDLVVVIDRRRAVVALNSAVSTFEDVTVWTPLGRRSARPCPAALRSPPPLGLGFEHPLMAHGLVLGSMGLDLGAIQGHVAQAHQARLLAEPQHLHKQPR